MLYDCKCNKYFNTKKYLTRFFAVILSFYCRTETRTINLSSAQQWCTNTKRRCCSFRSALVLDGTRTAPPIKLCIRLYYYFFFASAFTSFAGAAGL